jgi:DNA-binding CsgD family transcriptional regulator
MVASADYGLGVLEYRRGNTREAERLLHDALAVRYRDGFRPGVADVLDVLAVIAADGESDREAVRLFAFCSALRAQWGFTAWPLDRSRPAECVSRLRENLGDDEFAVVWAEGEALSLDDAVAYAARARSERKRPSSGWDALTPMELRVVSLAAEGLTNPQIAEQLFVARGTVKVHLSHIFAKLGVATRAELASEATRRGSVNSST